MNIHKKIKKEEKAQLKQAAMDMHLLHFFKRILDPLHFSLSKGLHLLILLLSRLFFVFWTVNYPAHWNQTFTIQDHINGRKGAFFTVALFLQIQIYHKIEKKDNEKCFKIPKTPSLHPCLNQVRQNEICSNVQIKPKQIYLEEKEKKKMVFQYLWLKWPSP